MLSYIAGVTALSFFTSLLKFFKGKESSAGCWHPLRPVYSNTTQLIWTQLNSTQLTQLNSAQPTSQSARSKSVVFLFMTSACWVQLNSVELSCVAINTPLRARYALVADFGPSVRLLSVCPVATSKNVRGTAQRTVVIDDRPVTPCLKRYRPGKHSCGQAFYRSVIFKQIKSEEQSSEMTWSLYLIRDYIT